MTEKRGYFSLVCLPPDEGGLVAIGGYSGNDKFIDVVEWLDGEGTSEWRRLASLPLPLASRVAFTSSRGFWLLEVTQRAVPPPQPPLHLLPRQREALANGLP